METYKIYKILTSNPLIGRQVFHLASLIALFAMSDSQNDIIDHAFCLLQNLKNIKFLSFFYSNFSFNYKDNHCLQNSYESKIAIGHEKISFSLHGMTRTQKRQNFFSHQPFHWLRCNRLGKRCIKRYFGIHTQSFSSALYKFLQL